MYTVETRHHTKAWRNGDLEDKLELIDSRNFKTRTSAKEYIEKKLEGHRDVQRHYHKGNETSNCYYFTGQTWTHENTGEEMQEYYHYKMFKTKAS